MRVSEWLIVAYFAYLAGVALFVRAAPGRRHRIWAIWLLVTASSVALARFGHVDWVAPIRDWAPALWLLLGYWLPAALVSGMNEPLERQLLSLDQRWFGGENTSGFDRLSRGVKDVLEVAYLLCYPMVPLGLACLYLAGLDGADRFWTAVLLAGFACYGVLPWAATRPPRLLEQPTEGPHSGVRHLNMRVLGGASIGLNTFPSAHVATSLTTALVVSADLPIAGALLGLLAIAIAIGSVTGRYHYAADAIAGAGVAVLAFLISILV